MIGLGDSLGAEDGSVQVDSGSIFNEFDEMRREMERMFEETIQDVEKVPRDLVREYQTPTGDKVREIGPIVYGYSVTVGADGRPIVREFGNRKAGAWRWERRAPTYIGKGTDWQTL